MSIQRASAKRKGRDLENKIARIMGGKRTPRSGAIGGAMSADVSFDSDSIFSPLHIEAKKRAAIPGYVAVAYAQAKAACSNLKSPAVIIEQDRGEPFIFMDLQEFVQFTTALAELGDGYRLKSLVRGAQRALREIEEAI